MKILITYIVIVALAAFSNAQNTTNPDLPSFQYNLTQEPEAQRQQLCELNKGFCETNCGGPSKAPMNFCNETTMGWGCGCIDKVPDLIGYEWPINRQQCVGSGESCKTACANPNIPDTNKPKCNQACIETYSQTCGTPQQPPAYYSVPDINTVPTYAPPVNATSTAPIGGAGIANNTNSTNSTNQNNNDKKHSSASALISNLGSAATALVIIASGMSLL